MSDGHYSGAFELDIAVMDAVQRHGVDDDTESRVRPCESGFGVWLHLTRRLDDWPHGTRAGIAARIDATIANARGETYISEMVRETFDNLKTATDDVQARLPLFW